MSDEDLRAHVLREVARYLLVYPAAQDEQVAANLGLYPTTVAELRPHAEVWLEEVLDDKNLAEYRRRRTNPLPKRRKPLLCIFGLHTRGQFGYRQIPGVSEEQDVQIVEFCPRCLSLLE